jgi:DNA-binding transcriptional MocR family regulator
MNRALSPERLTALVGAFPRAPAYRGLRQAMQELIGDGRIPLGTRLPSERAVAQALDLSRNTVTRAYADLIAAGFATVRQGSGTYAAVPLDRRRAHDHALLARSDAHPAQGMIDLVCAASAATPGVAAAYERALAALPAYLGSDGYLPSGLPVLQALIAEGYARRGLPTRPEQIVITSGALSALAIAARALSRPGDRIMLESPVYSNAIEALRIGGGRLVSAPLLDAGWDLDGIEATLQQTAPHLAYLIPDFQNPTGFLMRDDERARYAASLRATRTVAIVDEALQATSLSGATMPAPFATHAADAITIGSASKLYWGGLRVGWIRAPRDLVDRLVKVRVQFDLGSSLFDQLVMTELMGDESIAELRRSQLLQRRDALAQALREHLPDWRFRLPEGGLTLWLQMPQGSATRLAAQAELAGVHLAPGPVFSVEGGGDTWLRFPYAKPEEALVQAVQRLAHLWSSHTPGAAQGQESSRPLIA